MNYITYIVIRISIRVRSESSNTQSTYILFRYTVCSVMANIVAIWALTPLRRRPQASKNWSSGLAKALRIAAAIQEDYLGLT